eukprot:747943_1
MNTNVIQMVLICSCQRVTINKSSDYVRIRILNGINYVSQRILKAHCDDLCHFLDIKCGNRIDIQQRFIEQFLVSYARIPYFYHKINQPSSQTRCKVQTIRKALRRDSLKSTDFYVKFKPFVEEYNGMMKIISQSKQSLSEEECDMLRRFKVSLETKWNVIKSARTTDKKHIALCL